MSKCRRLVWVQQSLKDLIRTVCESGRSRNLQDLNGLVQSGRSFEIKVIDFKTESDRCTNRQFKTDSFFESSTFRDKMTVADVASLTELSRTVHFKKSDSFWRYLSDSVKNYFSQIFCFSGTSGTKTDHIFGSNRSEKDRILCIDRFQTILRESVKLSNFEKLFWSCDSSW